MADIFRGIDTYMYNIDIAPTVWTEKEARAEYSRLRKIANKRIARLQQSDVYSKARAAQKAMFQPLQRDASARQIYGALASVARFTGSATSSISGIRAAERKQLETMRDRGYTFLNKSNIHDFGKYWEEIKRHGIDRAYDSERIAKAFGQAKRKKIDPLALAANFEAWTTKEGSLRTDKDTAEMTSSAAARERLGK